MQFTDLEYDILSKYMLDTCDLVLGLGFCELYRLCAAVEDGSILCKVWYIRKLLHICRLRFRSGRRWRRCRSSCRGRSNDVQRAWTYKHVKF
jgi:hypothetical protein